MEKERFFTSKRMTGLAVLIALSVVLQILSGIFPSLVPMNFALIPITLAGILYGIIGGAIVGFSCGVVVLVQVITMGGSNLFYQMIWTQDPFVTTLTCLVKTTVAGVLSGLFYKLTHRKNELVSVFVAGGIVPIVNTALFIVGCLFMTSVQGMAGGQNLLVFIMVGLVGFNFFFELLTSLLVCPTLHKVIGVLKKNFRRK